MELELETASAKATASKAAGRMSGLNLWAAAIAILYAGPVFAQRDDGMEMQRCVWSCLARSSGNQDPAYQACVERVCTPKQRPISSPQGPSIQRQVAGTEVETVREIQLLLKGLGYEPGPVDGQLGGETQRALQRFQRVGNLPATGEPTPSTIAALRQAYQNAQNGGLIAQSGSTLLENDPAAGQAANKAGNQAGQLPAPVQVPTTGNGYQWLGAGATNGNNATLIYGVPGTDDVVISFLCDSATKLLAVTYIFEPVGAHDGMRIDMELSSHGRRVSLSAIGQRVKLNDEFRLEARTKNGLAIAEILNGGRTLSIRVQKRTISIPLAGAKPGVAGLVTACT